MWIFSVDGFYSAVESRVGGLVVRARFREDLEHLIKRGLSDKIVDTPDYDYPYRIFTTRKAWSKYVADSAMNIDYPNFKGRVLPGASEDRYFRYHKVWEAMAFPTRVSKPIGGGYGN